jgi:FtsZ-interacting cell division protein ZipA
MSELQLGLLIAGALAVVAVLVYNRFQERSARREAEQAFPPRHSDVLLAQHSARREPMVTAAVARRDDDVAVSPEEDLPDSRLDYVIEFGAETPIAVARVLEGWQTLERRFARRVLLATLDSDGRWRRIGVGTSGAYARWRAALQLVSRDGVIGEGELVEFRSEIETLAAHGGAAVSAPEMRQALDAARALDRECAEADIQVAFHVVAPRSEGLDADKVRSALDAEGLSIQDDDRWTGLDAGGNVLYHVTTAHRADAVLRLTITMDVPRTPQIKRSYESMVLLVRGLANALGGTLEDDNGRILDERALSAIGAQLEVVRERLERHGFSPGDVQTLRLFS